MEFSVPLPEKIENISPCFINWKLLKQRYQDHQEEQIRNSLNDSSQGPYMQSSLFRHLCGNSVLELLKPLPCDVNNGEATADSLLVAIENLCLPWFILLYQRYLFFSCTQTEGEPVSTFLQQLQKLSYYCNFSAEKEKRVKEQLLKGVVDDEVRQKLETCDVLSVSSIDSVCNEVQNSLGAENVDFLEQGSSEGEGEEDLQESDGEQADAMCRVNMEEEAVASLEAESASISFGDEIGSIQHENGLKEPDKQSKTKDHTDTEKDKGHSLKSGKRKVRKKRKRSCEKRKYQVYNSELGSQKSMKKKRSSSRGDLSATTIDLSQDPVDNPAVSLKCSVCNAVFTDSLDFDLHYCTYVSESMKESREDITALTQDDDDIIDMYDEMMDGSTILNGPQDISRLTQLDNYDEKVEKVYEDLARVCNLCGLINHTALDHKRHMRQRHRGYCKCNICGVMFLRQSSCWRHLITQHCDQLPHKCDVCVAAFKLKSSLDFHRLEHSKDVLICNECGEEFQDRKILTLHVRKKHRANRFPCKTCGMSFSYLSLLKLHQMKHTGERPFVCEICGSAHIAQSILNRHKRIHSDKRQECSVCGRRFVYAGTLKKHMRTHTGEKPFVCDMCGKCFNNNTSLKEHMRSHTGERPYPCTDCGATFARSTHLLRHRRMHSGEKPHACDICGSKFTRLSNLKSHKKSVHDRVVEPSVAINPGMMMYDMDRYNPPVHQDAMQALQTHTHAVPGVQGVPGVPSMPNVAGVHGVSGLPMLTNVQGVHADPRLQVDPRMHQDPRTHLYYQ